MPLLPASQTKHLPLLHHPIPRNPTIELALIQITSTSTKTTSSSSAITTQTTNTGTGTTGTTLWSSSQVLSAYLSSLPSITSAPPGKKALELGAGVGYLSLCLASWGWEVTSTDIEPVLSTVLVPNIEFNLPKLHNTGSVRVVQVDWTVPLPKEVLEEEYDLIITADTIYHTPLTLPLFETIKEICKRQKVQPVIYLGLERRDSGLVDWGLGVGREVGFEIGRVGRGRVGKALDRAGWAAGREKGGAKSENSGEGVVSDEEEEGAGGKEEGGFDGVEVWKARWKGLKSNGYS